MGFTFYPQLIINAIYSVTSQWEGKIDTSVSTLSTLIISFTKKTPCRIFLFDFSQRLSALPYRLFLTVNELSEPLGWWITMITHPPWRYGTRYYSITYFLTVPKSVGSHLTSDVPFENVDLVPYLDSRLFSHKVGLGYTYIVRNQ